MIFKYRIQKLDVNGREAATQKKVDNKEIYHRIQ